MGLVGAALYAFVNPVGAMVVWGLAAFFLLLALVSPSVYETLGELVTYLASRLTTGIGLLVLIGVWALIFVPAAWLLRLRGRDPLRRRFPMPGSSNWKTRIGYGDDPEIYTRQYTRPHGEVPDA